MSRGNISSPDELTLAVTSLVCYWGPCLCSRLVMRRARGIRWDGRPLFSYALRLWLHAWISPSNFPVIAIMHPGNWCHVLNTLTVTGLGADCIHGQWKPCLGTVFPTRAWYFSFRKPNIGKYEHNFGKCQNSRRHKICLVQLCVSSECAGWLQCRLRKSPSQYKNTLFRRTPYSISR